MRFLRSSPKVGEAPDSCTIFETHALVKFVVTLRGIIIKTKEAQTLYIALCSIRRKNAIHKRKYEQLFGRYFCVYVCTISRNAGKDSYEIEELAFCFKNVRRGKPQTAFPFFSRLRSLLIKHQKKRKKLTFFRGYLEFSYQFRYTHHVTFHLKKVFDKIYRL